MNRRALRVGELCLFLLSGTVMAQTPAVPPGPGGSSGQPAVQTAAPPAKVSLLGLLLKGGPVMYPLGLCSVIMIAFAIERAIGLRRSKVLPPATLRAIRDAVNVPSDTLDPKKLLKELESHEDPLARISVAGLRKANRSLPEIEKAMEDAGARETSSMRRNCRALSICASIAPLLGLLGTVSGIIRAFMTVAEKAEAMGRTEMLAGGIYEALVCTAVGLAIAIPSLVLYYIYVERSEGLISEIDSTLEALVAKIPAK